MGGKYTVKVWLINPYGDGENCYLNQYCGNSIFAAIRTMIAFKRISGCVALEWRG